MNRTRALAGAGFAVGIGIYLVLVGGTLALLVGAIAALRRSSR